MGLSTAGLAFKPTSSTPDDEEEMIRRAFGKAFHAVSASEVRGSHDVRVLGNIAVESKNDAIFIYNGEIAERILFKGEAVESTLLSALGTPELAVVFCHYDSGGSFGYVILEDGMRIRSRIHTLDKTSDEGNPMDFELSWLKARLFVEEEGEPPVYRNTETGQTSTEAYVTANMLDVAMKTLFGVCPWDEWNYKSKFNYYCTALAAEPAKIAVKKARWKFW